MWIVCITSVRHVLTVNGYGGRQTKENEKSWCFKGWETLVCYKLINGFKWIMKSTFTSIVLRTANIPAFIVYPLIRCITLS